MTAAAQLIISKPKALTEPAYLRTLMLASQIVFTHLVPQPLSMYLDVSNDSLPSTLRMLYLSGEVLPASLVQRLHQVHPRLRVFNRYGPAECTVDVTMFDCARSSAPIGPPLQNSTCYVHSTRQQEMPIGVTAELSLGGPKVSRGYIGRPELTAQQFSMASVGTGRMYKTGDRVCWLPSGSLDFMGRVDFQIKLNGQRIEPGEIESVIRSTPGVKNVVVTLSKYSSGRDQIIAHLILHSGNDGTAPVHHSCLTKLPAYMVPSSIVTWDHWPLSQSGKVDRKMLRLRTNGQCTENNVQCSRTSNGTESSLQRLVADKVNALVGTPLAAEDSLMVSGLNSLNAVRLHHMLQTELQIKFSSAAAFEHPTIAALTLFLSESGASVQLDSSGGIELQDQNDSAFLDRIADLTGKRWTIAELKTHLEQTVPENQPVKTHTNQLLVGVVGMACNLPGNIDSPDLLWRTLCDCITHITTEIPAGLSRVLPEDVTAGAFLEDVIRDGLVPPIVLGTAKQALNECAAHKTCRHLGIFSASHHDGDEMTVLLCDKLGFPRQSCSVLAHFNCTTTASHLALHEACANIRNGNCDGALIVASSLFETCWFSDATPIISASGKVSGMSTMADGIVFAEGCAAVVLQPVTDAADNPLALILGSAVTTNSPHVPPDFPDQDAEEEAILQALQACNVDRSQISFVEMVANGVKVGDFTEIAAVANALAPDQPSAKPLLLTGVRARLLSAQFRLFCNVVDLLLGDSLEFAL